MSKGRVSKFFVWTILGLLFVALAGFGATNFGGSVQSVGQVGDTDIEANEYGRALQQELRALSSDTGQAITLSQARAFGVDRAVLGRLVAQAALDNETTQLGLSVGDQTVGEQVTSLPAFRGIDGTFDRESYTFALENAGLTVAAFEEQVRADTARNILQAAVTGGIAASETFTETIYDWAREERDITWIRLGPQDLREPLGEPSDADLRAFHQENAALFTLPETRVITYAWLTPDMILDQVSPDEAALRALYEERRDEYVRPERRLVERLVFSTEDAARAAKERLDAGDTTFAELVSERGLALDDIDLGDVTVSELGEAGPAVFEQDGTGVFGPLPSSLGPALFRVNAVLSATETRFEDAREDLAAEWSADRARREIDSMLGEFDDLLAGGATLEELAQDTDMRLGTIDFRADVEDGIAAYQDFRDRALVVDEEDFPELFEFQEGGVFAIRLDEIRPPTLQPFQDVLPDVIAAWERAETARLLTETALDAATRIENGAEMAGLDLPIRMETGLGRDAFLDDAPPEMVENLFQMDAGDVRVFTADDGAALVRLDAIRAPDQNSPEARELKAAFAAQSAQSLAGDALDLFTQAVQTSAGITINQQAINAIHAQFP